MVHPRKFVSRLQFGNSPTGFSKVEGPGFGLLKTSGRVKDLKLRFSLRSWIKVSRRRGGGGKGRGRVIKREETTATLRPEVLATIHSVPRRVGRVVRTVNRPEVGRS